MTDTLNTAPTTPPQTRRPHPFPHEPGRWEAERARALRANRQARDGDNPLDCRPVLVHESSRWGWLAWPVPADGSQPDNPLRLGILTPTATRLQRLALPWLTRRPARRIALTPRIPGSVRAWAAVTGLTCLTAGLFAMSRGLPWDVAVPAMLLTPLLAERLPAQLDARAERHVRTVDSDAAVRYLHRLTSMQTVLDQGAAGSDCYELRRSAQVGQHVLWDAAGLLQDQDTRTVSAALIARERLMVQLVDQVTAIRAHLTGTPATRLGPYPPGHRPATHTASHDPHATTLQMRSPAMPHSDPSDRTTDVYLLFAHEPYFPDEGIQEINTTVVTADTLLHPQVQQPDGARIHDLLTRGREPGAVVPLATLTHELGGGTNWPSVGDFERVTGDLVALAQRELCDGLSLRLPELDRALVCIGPAAGQEVRIFGLSAGDFLAYGQEDRDAVLAGVRRILSSIKAERPLWPGDGLLPPLGDRA
ncbi:hypothetical protein [Streptomyces sp. NPDC127036]|uniref:hypothetical protein n=1 Tax=Streptomyces sp. NPDC127036 TaxID=3347112 RepID=UPI00366A537A